MRIVDDDNDDNDDEAYVCRCCVFVLGVMYGDPGNETDSKSKELETGISSTRNCVDAGGLFPSNTGNFINNLLVAVLEEDSERLEERCLSSGYFFFRLSEELEVLSNDFDLKFLFDSGDRVEKEKTDLFSLLEREILPIPFSSRYLFLFGGVFICKFVRRFFSLLFVPIFDPELSSPKSEFEIRPNVLF